MKATLHARWRIPDTHDGPWTTISYVDTEKGREYRDLEAAERIADGYEVQVGDGARPRWTTLSRP
jgi:hypothetical protein